MNFKEFALSLLVSTLQVVGVEKLVELLRQYHKNDPASCEQTLVSFYPVLDVQLEELAKATKTKIDDALIQGFKGAFETFAAEINIILPNLDKD